MKILLIATFLLLFGCASNRPFRQKLPDLKIDIVDCHRACDELSAMGVEFNPTTNECFCHHAIKR